MAYTDYRVIPLAESGGLPIVPGCHHVSPQTPFMFVAYDGDPHPTHHSAIIYKDDSGKYLVGAQPNVFPRLPAGQTLAVLIDADPAEWETYNCDTYTENGETVEAKNKKSKSTKIKKDISASKPVKLKDGKNEYAVGAQGSASHACGDFSPEMIEAITPWMGDHL